MYQLTIFSGFLVIHCKRIKSKRNGVLCCLKYKDNYKGEVKSVHKKKAFKLLEKLSKLCKKTSKNFNKLYKYLITTRTGNVIVFMLFLVYISLTSMQFLWMREGIEFSDLVEDKSYFRHFYADNLKNIDINPFVMLVFYKPIEYSPKNVDKLITFINKTQQATGIRKDFLLNWMTAFQSPLSDWHEYKDESYLLAMVNSILPFSNDIVVRLDPVDNKRHIVASRVFLQYEKIYYSSQDAVPMQTLRKICDESGLPVFAYANTFKFYEQFEQTVPNIIQSFIIALESMYIIALIFVPDLQSTICIILSMISIMIGLVGCMHLWGLALSSITMVELIMSIGFCIDFSVHVTHAFIACVGPGSKRERAYKACLRTGLPVFNSAISTVAGFCFLGFKQSFVYMSFFKAVVILMSLGVINSMLFLPVLLGIMGPHWKQHDESDSFNPELEHSIKQNGNVHEYNDDADPNTNSSESSNETDRAEIQ